MIQPLFQLMATQPDVLSDHLQAYAELLGDEVGSFQGQFKRRWVLWAVLALLMTITLILGGVALMLWLLTPTAQLAQLQAPWALWIVPGAMAGACAVVFALIHSQKHSPSFQVIREQIAADVAMFKQADLAS
jgi:uncharacterized membrane protein YqjE